MIARATHYSLTGSVSGRPEFAPPERRSAVAASVGVHLAFAVVAIVLLHGKAVEQSTPDKTSLMYVAIVPAVPVHRLAAPPKPTPRPIAAIEPPAPAMLKPAPIAPPPPPKALAVDIEPPAPIVPMPTTSPAVDLLAANVQKPQENSVRVGAFGAVTAGRARSRDELAAVTSAGFGDAVARPVRRAVGTSVAAGFDRETAAPQPVTLGPPVAALDSPTGAFDTPIEILFKPKPRYTDEAEALGLQGTVVLEVEFTASNEVRVVRVIRSLGHGLDEAAARAAEQIRFKPARRQGAPVDCRVTVQIEFRIT